MQKQGQDSVAGIQLHPKYKNIIFDLGGVLLKYNPQEIMNDLFDESQRDEVVRLMGAMHKMWLTVDKGLLSPQAAAEKLAESFDKNIVTKFTQEVPKRFKPMDGGVDILKKIKEKGYKTYILSNLSQVAYDSISSYDFLKEFDGAIFSYQHKSVKPESEIYQALLTTYGLNPEECLFIDDLDVNIQAAKDHGIDGIVCKDHTYVLEQLLRLNVL